MKEPDTYPGCWRAAGRRAGRRWEVRTAAGAAPTSRALNDAFEQLLRYEPDVVVLGMVLNDAEQLAEFRARSGLRERLDPRPGAPASGGGPPDFGPDRLERRRLDRATPAWYRQMYGSPNREGWARTQAHLKAMARRMRARGDGSSSRPGRCWWTWHRRSLSPAYAAIAPACCRGYRAPRPARRPAGATRVAVGPPPGPAPQRGGPPAGRAEPGPRREGAGGSGPVLTRGQPFRNRSNARGNTAASVAGGSSASLRFFAALARARGTGSPPGRAGGCTVEVAAARARRASRGCRARRCGRPRPPGSGRRGGWSRAGGR